jgi:Polysaccharide deacetylase
MSTALSSALVVEPGRIPAALPRTLDEIEAPLGYAAPPVAPPAEPTTLFLTIDTEDNYFTPPVLMTGEGIGREFGVFGILDQLDAHDMKATFFVNVYETDRQPAGVVEGVVREIAERGHEVGLHSHPSPGLGLYRRPLFHLPATQQTDILRWGADLIDRWTGAPPISFRAGGYALDDNTFTALEDVGIAIDSSCLFSSENNRQERFTVNAIASRGSVVEAPITTVLRHSAGDLEQRKLDINWLSVPEMINALAAVGESGLGFATFMMHSFSFIRKATRRDEEKSSPDAIFTSDDIFGYYVDVLGSSPRLRDAFDVVLDLIANDPKLRVRTLAAALPELTAAAGATKLDAVPLVSCE